MNDSYNKRYAPVNLSAFAHLWGNIERYKIPSHRFLPAVLTVTLGPEALKVLDQKQTHTSERETFYYAVLDNNEVLPIGTTIENNTVGVDLQIQRLTPNYIIKHTLSEPDDSIRINEDDRRCNTLKPKVHHVEIFELLKQDYDNYVPKKSE